MGTILNALKYAPTWLQVLALAWLLSGVAIIVALSRLKIEKPATTQKVEIVNQPIPEEVVSLEFKPTPTPTEIFKAIDAQPPFQQEKFAENYDGLKIHWQGRFKTVLGSGKDLVTLGIEDDSSSAWFSCPVKLADFPELKIMPKGTHVEVRGTIQKITMQIIYLESATVKISPKPDAEK